VEIANDGGKADGEEGCDSEKGDGEQKRNGEATGDVAPTAQLDAHDGSDGGHEDHGEERADVDEQENLAQTPR
jgi:hypothetical protein